MPHLHFRRTVYKSGGHKASDRITYITRDVEHTASHAERQLRYATRAEREDLVYTHSRNLPSWTQGDPHVYFRAAEQYERAPDAKKRHYRGVAFEEWKITLPQELTKGQNMTLMRHLVDVIAGETLPITYAFHCPQTLDATQAQPHLHLLISTRHTDGIARSASHHFKRYNRTHPERGGAQKARDFSRSTDVKAWRVTISDVVNLHLERAGIPDRVHPESLKDRGIDREPEPKLLPSESRAYREGRTVGPQMQAVLEVRAQRKETRLTEQTNARAYWEERKVTLGITDAMDLPAQLAAVCEARAQVRDHAPARRVVASQGEQRLQDVGQEAADDAWRDAVLLWAEEQGARALREVGWEALQEAREEGQEALTTALYEQRLYARARAWTSLEQDLWALTRQLDALAEEQGSTGRVRVRLWEREQGMGF